MPPASSGPSLQRPSPSFWQESWPWLLGTLALWLVLGFGASLARVSGDSMNPTLRSGDTLLLLKYPRWLDPDFPRRGSVVVFRGPPDSPYAYATHTLLGLEFKSRPVHIKRVLALPGDQIELRGGQVWVNGQALAENYAPGSWVDDQAPRTLAAGELWVMGDNRQVGSSLDSRAYGPVRVRDVLGEVPQRLWPEPGRLP
ncbi:signal peptidase I [Deinococcus piscis]|uniref:Signal peptidase I n=1 Tax=Deinococcus piscis TaxID=394230 RepID=A0ABQ3JZT1_9DEIO|nr:signal peptidase I [Deinococcus piscis]GHF96825.1 signal peptidase I [Deinococcus piscis]